MKLDMPQDSVMKIIFHILLLSSILVIFSSTAIWVYSDAGGGGDGGGGDGPGVAACGPDPGAEDPGVGTCGPAGSDSGVSDVGGPDYGGGGTPSPINGSCGSSNNVCSAGSVRTAPADTSTRWLWTCNGSNGGTNASCSKNKPINGSCGSSNNVCSAGSVRTAPADTSARWLWTCNGSNGGTNASCSKNKPINGSCGSANINYDYNDSFPSGSYCSAGSQSGAANPPYGGSDTWSCNGSYGGSNASCTATRDSFPIGSITACDLGDPITDPDCVTGPGTKEILTGEEVVIYWSSTYAPSCSFFDFDGDDGDGDPTTGGDDTTIIEPLGLMPKTFTTWCPLSDAAVSSVTVENISPAPVSIRSEGPPIVRSGEEVTIIWDINGNNESDCSISGPGTTGIDFGAVTDDMTDEGSFTDSITNMSTYTVSCDNGADVSSASVTIQVVPSSEEN